MKRSKLQSHLDAVRAAIRRLACRRCGAPLPPDRAGLPVGDGIADGRLCDTCAIISHVAQADKV